MTRIPSSIIRASIKTGSVYYFRDERLSSPQKHFMVVINKTPTTDEFILFVCGQHKVKNVKQFRSNCSPETLVVITPKQYSGFRVDTIFDCNNLFPQNINSVARKYEHQDLLVKPEIDTSLVMLLQQGVIASKQIEKRFKKILV